MLNRVLATLALSSLFVSPVLAQYADGVVSYNPGAGYIRGFTNASVALGEPSRVTSGLFGGPVDPFDPPYLPAQLVSMGAGGSLTVSFSRPILNHPRNRFGVDFVVFGNAGFVITNDFDVNTFNFVGTPATDSSLFGANPGVTRVSASRDGVTFYELKSPYSQAVDGLLPTDGLGDFHTPADPALIGADFAGQTLDGIRALYLGSAGGTGYDLSWAVNTNGQPVKLETANYIRIEVLSGKSEIDGIAAVFVPLGRK
jgi:hypothetical protein